MMVRMRPILPLVAATLVAWVAASNPVPEKRWYRGNTHTHTLWSDGDGAPELVTDWYKTHGYHFLVLSDHNILAEGEKWVPVGRGKRLLPPEWVKGLADKFGKDAVEVRTRGGRTEMRLKTLSQLRGRFEEKERFLLITGEEITDKFRDIPVHHNSINQKSLIPPTGGSSVRDMMRRTLRAVKEEAEKTGRPVLVHLNHPNWKWAVSPDDVAHVLEERFFEVYDGARDSENYGDARHMSTEQMWDYVLTLRRRKLGGEILYGLGTDDAHEYYKDQAVSNPGRGWVWVRAEALTPDAITRAMLAGDFYASSGVELKDIRSDAESLTVDIKADPGVTYTTRFIGTRREGKKIGEVLQETKGASATYRFRGDELYVRATVVSSRRHPNGYRPEDFETAWIQPVVPGE